MSRLAETIKGYQTIQLPMGRLTLARWFSIICFFALWQGISMYNEANKLFNPVFLPSPVRVLQAGYELYLSGELVMHILASTARLVVGFGLGAIIAITLGILIGRSKMFESVIDPIINLIGPIPPFAFLPIFIIWLGIGERSKLTLIAYATFLPILAYTVDGIKSVNPLLIRSAYSLGASEMQIFRRVILKSALPNVFVGMRISLALCFSALVVAEMIGAEAGLGYLIIDSRNFFKMYNMFLAAALIGLEYTVFALLFSKVEARLFAWRKGGLEHAIEA